MVYRLAKALGIQGWVSNASDGLHIEFNASESVADNFYQSCIKKKPAQAHITEHQMVTVANHTFQNFSIVESTEKTTVELAITPDFALCKSCREELIDPSNSRFQYPFITCTQCGPRYSILTGIPYDRPLTTMAGFEMCSSCRQEYDSPLDRRYYSQTNSCGTCGIQLTLQAQSDDLNTDDQDEIMHKVIHSLHEGKIIAVKGIGGYLLLCDAASAKPVNTLRKRKSRPSKPFAVMYPNMAMLTNEFNVDEDESVLLEGPISPIVLLPRCSENQPGIVTDNIAPGLNAIGVMLPYAPLLQLICQSFGRPVVATSANSSGTPIIYQDNAEAFEELYKYADLILSHNREIAMPQDDSVVRLSQKARRAIKHRRSRGIAPNLLQIRRNYKSTALAMGAEMKSTFSMAFNQNAYCSQYLGNLAGFENQQSYEKVLKQFLDLVHVEPEQILVDEHPQYFTHQLGKELSAEWHVPVKMIQHHEAHFAAILGEHNLDASDQPVLGVIWDGTGYGSDKAIWGGEFFDFNKGKFSRLAHLAYFKVLSRDKMALEPRLPALSLLGTTGGEILRPCFSEQEWVYYRKLLTKPGLETSSMGRVFDAVAFLMGFREANTYEGQAAVYLEQLAQDYISAHPHEQIESFPFEIEGKILSLRPMLDEIIGSVPKEYSQIAARFHQTLVSLIREMARQHGYQQLAFSGGVFQNALLVDLISEQLEDQFELYFHESLSPNDENIAFGQLIHHEISLASQKDKLTLKQNLQCV
ncbi:MAG: carbamoyltransferase HypF [Roseivirga sp.]